MAGKKELTVEQGKKKAGRVAGNWSEDTGKNPDDLEIGRENEDI